MSGEHAEEAALAGQGQPDSSADRLRRFFAYMFAKHDPGQQMPPMPEELSEWARDTMLATFFGVVLSGGRQWMQERSSGPVQAPAAAATKAHAARAMAEEQTQRLARIANASTRGGLTIGGLAAVFYGTQMLSGIYRNQYDFYNTAYGGMAAGAMLGAALNRGSPAVRLRSVILGAALGASVGVPAGMLQDKVVALLPPEQQVRRQQRMQQTEAIIAGTVAAEAPQQEGGPDPACLVIQQLEASLAASPTRRKEEAGGEQGGGPAANSGGSGWRWWGGGDS